MTADVPHRVVVEVIHLHHERADRSFSWRVVSAPLPAGMDPDDAALALLPEAGEGTGTVCHSTSWRWAPEDAVVLTYATVTTIPSTESAIGLGDTFVVTSGDALRPRPPQLHAHHVVAHAVQHLADLAQRDPAIRAVAQQSENQPAWRDLETVARELRTSTHDSAHASGEVSG